MSDSTIGGLRCNQCLGNLMVSQATGACGECVQPATDCWLDQRFPLDVRLPRLCVLQCALLPSTSKTMTAQIAQR